MLVSFRVACQRERGLDWIVCREAAAMCPPPAERKQRAKWTVPSGFECVRAPERVSVCVRVRVRGVGWSRDGFGPVASAGRRGRGGGGSSSCPDLVRH